MKKIFFALIVALCLFYGVYYFDNDKSIKMINKISKEYEAKQFDQCLKDAIQFNQIFTENTPENSGLRFGTLHEILFNMAENYQPARKYIEHEKQRILEYIRKIDSNFPEKEIFYKYHEFVSYYRSEGSDSAVIVKEFQDLHKKSPNLAKRCISIVDEFLLKEKSELFRHYFPDLEDYLENEWGEVNLMLKYKKSNLTQSDGLIDKVICLKLKSFKQKLSNLDAFVKAEENAEETNEIKLFKKFYENQILTVENEIGQNRGQ